MENLEGQDIGQYHLDKRLGRGGFADVYRGQDNVLDKEVAIKVLHTRISDDDEKAFFYEARKTARLNHYNIIRIINYLVQDSKAFIVLDYAPNGTLRERHPKGSRLSPDTIVDYVLQVADALQYAHNKDMIHCDVKPENLLIGEHNQVLLSDFGVAIALKSLHVNLQRVGGTLSYIAPEQLQGKPCFASDQYSLAAVVYEWVCGKPPFQGTPDAIVNQHLYIPPPRLSANVPDLPQRVEEVVLRALSKNPNYRYESVQQFANALKQASYAPKLEVVNLNVSGTLNVPSTSQLSNENTTPSSSETVPDPPEIQQPGPIIINAPPVTSRGHSPIVKNLLFATVIPIIAILAIFGLVTSNTFNINKLFLNPTPIPRPSPTLTSTNLTATATHSILSFTDHAPVSTNQATQAAPSLTYFNGEFYLAFIANDSTNRILLIHSSDGINWSPNLALPQASQTAPSLAVFNGQLYLAFIADDSTNRILLIHSSDGINWSPGLLVGQASKTAPSLAAFNGQLYLAFVANDSSNNLLIVSSQDGSTWSSNVLFGQASQFAPVLAAFNNQLYLAFIADNASRDILLTSSSSGTTWTGYNLTLGASSNATPALASFDGKLYLAFIANTNTLSLLSSSDGTYWQPNTNISQISVTPPALYSQDQKPQQNHLYLAFVASDNTVQIDQSEYDPI